MFAQLKNHFLNAGMLVKIIAINAVVFVLINVVYLVFDLALVQGVYMEGSHTPKVVYWLSAPSNVALLLMRPWTWFTYMFLHEGIWHLFFNMLMLYFSGRIFCDLLNDRRFLPTYIFGGLAGLLFFVAGYNIFPKLYQFNSILYGASASVMAVFVATATYFPNYEVYLFGVFRVKMKWLAVLYVAVDFVALRGSENVGGHLAHLGGAVYGFCYATRLTRGSDWSSGFYRFTGFFTSLFAPKRNVRVVHRSTSFQAANKPESQSKSEKQKVVDGILDKISRSGYESLSKEEKEKLLKAGED